MAFVKLSITVDPETDALLRLVKSRSRYIDRAVTERWRRWQSAIATFVGAGWLAEDGRSAASALVVCYLLGGPPHALLIAAAMRKTDPDAQAMMSLAAQVSNDPALAWAVEVAAREVWAENPEFDAALERLDA